MMTEAERKFFENLVNDLCNDYAFYRDVAIKIAIKAWDLTEDYDAVESKAIELSEFVEDILWLEMGHAGNHCFDESKFNVSKAYKKIAESENDI